jgi:hypothetical protein
MVLDGKDDGLRAKELRELDFVSSNTCQTRTGDETVNVMHSK